MGVGAASVEGFLVPGVDFAKLTFREGAWCRYAVVDEALGQVDTTDIYVAIVQGLETPRGDAYWVEIESRLRGASEEDREVMKLLVLERITKFSDGDSLGDYVLELYIKNGLQSPRREDPKKYKDFSLVIPTTDSTWQATESVSVATLAGEFSCTKKHRLHEDIQEIPTGNITLIKRARDDFAVWFADEIPIFHMAKCEILRLRETDTIPRISGIPVAGGKDSRTTAELTGFGFDAKSLIPEISMTDSAD